MNDQQLRISIGLRLGANICVGHTCHCGKRVERDGLHGIFAPRVMVASHVIYATLNSLIKQTLESFDLPSMLEPGNSRQDRDFRDRDQDCFVETETRDFLLKIRDFETFYKILTTREKLRDFLGKI